MLQKKIGSYIIAIILLAILSCNSDKDKDGVEDDIDKCDDVYAKTKDGCPVSPKEIGNVHFYVETSASMAGYFQHDAEFKTLISNLTIKIDKNIKPIDIWFISDTAKKYNRSAQQFSEDIANTQFAIGKSSQLHKIIADIASKNDSNDVSLLISDCILSFPPEEIRKNREINSIEAPNALKNNIFSTFSDLKNKGFGTSVYAFTSKFYSDRAKNIFYYDYQNNQKEMHGEKRPFYIWVIADKGLLTLFNKKLAGTSGFSPEKTLHFGLSENVVTNFDIIPQLQHNANWTWDKSEKTIEDINFKKKEQIQFTVLLDLKGLPEYVLDTLYLKDSLKVEAEGCKGITMEVKNKRLEDNKSAFSKSQIESLQNATHFITFTVDCWTNTKMHVTLPVRYDNWFEKWSTTDDRSAEGMANKTFAFKHLINGVKEAYETKNMNYIDFTITLKN